MCSVQIENNIVKLSKKIYQHPIFHNYFASKDGEIINVIRKRILKPQDNGIGYLQVFLFDECFRKKKYYYVHLFLDEAIKGEIPEGFEINHINAIKTDNNLKHLEVITHEENVQLARNKLNPAVISINFTSEEETLYLSLSSVSLDLELEVSYISKTCRKVKSFKTAKSKKDGALYKFKYTNDLVINVLV